MWYFHYDPEDIQRLFRDNRWDEILVSYSPTAVARELGLKNAMIVSQHLVTKGAYKSMLKDNARALLYVIKGMFPDEWELNPLHENLLRALRVK